MNKKPIYKSDNNTRSFGGKLSNFENREEAKLEKKHLKAYLQGKKQFIHGWEDVKIDSELLVEVEEGFTMRRPKVYQVKEIWTPKTETNEK